MTEPVRIQLKRTKGWKMPPNTVKVDRTTKWGNPFVPGQPGGAYTAKVKDRRHAWQLYRSVAFQNEALVAAARAELRGRNLACWCPQEDPYEDVCHAAVLLEIANASPRSAPGEKTSSASRAPEVALTTTGEGERGHG
jgi:hypothetical protein